MFTKNLMCRALALCLCACCIAIMPVRANELAINTNELESINQNIDNTFTLTKEAGKKIGSANPLYTQKFGADPWAMEYDGRVYVYMTNDIFEYDALGNIKDNTYGKIRHINVISSADMVNWTDHGSIPVAGSKGIAKWAGNSWAPCAAWRNENGEDKFYLYFTNGGGGIGVLVGDSPVGPWTDPNGEALVSHKTENCSGDKVPWCFDPAVFIDDDGQAYLYFGGGIPTGQEADPRSGRVVKLKDNLTEIDGVPQEIAPPYFFEAFAMHKYNEKYYLTYSSNFNSPGVIPGEQPGSGNIAYMMADAPLGPFTYIGEVLQNPGSFGFGGGNNHSCVFRFKDEWYIAYHGSVVSKDLIGKDGYRSTHIDRVAYKEDGTMERTTGTRIGIAQLQNINPLKRLEAETIAWNGGIKTTMQDSSQIESINLYVTGIERGDWISVANAEVDESVSGFTVCAAGLLGGTIELRSGSPYPDNATTKLISTLEIEAGDGKTWKEYSAVMDTTISGTQNLFLVFNGNANGTELFNLDWWQLTSAKVEPAKTPATEDITLQEPAQYESSSDDGSIWPWVGGLTGVLVIVGITVIVLKNKH